ncbi:hypothetical protein B0H10DRAFT_2212762 [Mycena sp. CBHHK59/15]|nr:hypothetical protein B0H10DRAFT_2212762 [Mycena sp. CBHHK59/15]
MTTTCKEVNEHYAAMQKLMDRLVTKVRLPYTYHTFHQMHFYPLRAPHREAHTSVPLPGLHGDANTEEAGRQINTEDAHTEDADRRTAAVAVLVHSRLLSTALSPSPPPEPQSLAAGDGANAIATPDATTSTLDEPVLKASAEGAQDVDFIRVDVPGAAS